MKPKTNNDVFISEGDVYREICRSVTKVRTPTPEVVEFENWLFYELLPTLRRTGTYTLDDGNVPTLMKIFREATNKLKKG